MSFLRVLRTNLKKKSFEKENQYLRLNGTNQDIFIKLLDLMNIKFIRIPIGIV